MNGWKMKAIKQSFFLARIALCFLVGCCGPEKSKVVEQICVPEISKVEVMQAAEDVLGQLNFSIEKSDANSGFIKTRPLQGAQFFELWRGDNVGCRNSLEANVQNIRRVAELQMNQAGGEAGNKLCISCDVKTQRLSLPEREVSSSARAYGMFSKSQKTIQRLNLDPEQKKQMLWIDLGSDPKLATKILKRIEKKIAQRQKAPKL